MKSNLASKLTQIVRHGLLASGVSLLLAGSLITACMRHEIEVKLFEDVTEISGLNGYTGMTHGAAWGDYDKDGRPDLYVTNHLRAAMLFRNAVNGRFENVTQTILGENNTGGDKHGAAWADFDNDGDQDLVQLTGAVEGVGAEPKRLFVNEDGKLIERGAQLGIDNPLGRTRMPLWLDIDQDGKLDLFQGAEARFDDLTPPFLFGQKVDHFVDVTPWMQVGSRSAPFCIATALNDDRFPEVVCRLMGKGLPSQVFDTRSLPAITLDVLPKTAFEDIAAGDFDNDGQMDLFLARKNPGGRVALASGGDKSLTAQVELTPQTVDKQSAFRFRSKGNLKIWLAGMHPGDLLPEDVRLGEKGTQAESLSLELGAGAAAGMPKPTADKRPAVLIGSPEAGVLQIEFHIRPEPFGVKNKPRNLTVRIQSSAPIEDIEALGDSATDETAPQRLFMNRAGKLEEESDKRGINERLIAAVNVVAADFDNDMDLDIFILGSGDAGKAENLLLLNDGKGHFTVVKNAGGAAGALLGVGDSVTTADIDNDGFIDILTASGASMGRSLGMPSNNGLYQLFRNVTNGNNWLMIDLEGTQSNRDGIGARVIVTAGGITQTRFQDGGIHERGQNHSRLHFGLAKSTRVDKIVVQWPSGKTQEISNSGVNQVMRIKELQ